MMSVSDFICHIITIIFMQIIFTINYKNMIKNKIDINFNYILSIFVTSVLIFVNNFYNLLFLRYLTGIIINLITIKIIYPFEKIKTITFFSIIHSVICIILELILTPLFLFKINDIAVFNNILYLKIMFSIFVGVITIYIFKNQLIINFIEKINHIIFNKQNLFAIFIFLLMFLDMLIFVRGMEINNFYAIFITINSLIFMIITIKIIINDKYNMVVLNNQSNSIKDNIKAYSKTIDDCRELKHNLRNDLLTLKSGVNKDSQDKINEIITKYNKNYEWINMIDEIPEGLQGLIYLKQKEAENHKIKLYVNTIKNINANNKDYIDLCSMLGVLIDNAIDASKNIKNRVIEINFKEIGKDLNIKISNNYNNDIDINKIGKKNYSTKKYKSGLGLNYIKNINNSKIKVNFKIVNNLFITDVLYSIKN